LLALPSRKEWLPAGGKRQRPDATWNSAPLFPNPEADVIFFGFQTSLLHMAATRVSKFTRFW
jgi:hypothetical protein